MLYYRLFKGFLLKKLYLPLILISHINYVTAKKQFKSSILTKPLPALLTLQMKFGSFHSSYPNDLRYQSIGLMIAESRSETLKLTMRLHHVDLRQKDIHKFTMYNRYIQSVGFEIACS